jgi:hypothetical protein
MRFYRSAGPVRGRVPVGGDVCVRHETGDPRGSDSARGGAGLFEAWRITGGAGLVTVLTLIAAVILAISGRYVR